VEGYFVRSGRPSLNSVQKPVVPSVERFEFSWADEHQMLVIDEFTGARRALERVQLAVGCHDNYAFIATLENGDPSQIFF
jgi:hypothetical protein